MKLTAAVAALAASLSFLGLADGAPAAHSPFPRQRSTIMKREVVKRDAILVSGLGGVNFKIRQVNNPRFQMNAASGPIALARAYRKYDVGIPPQLRASITQLLQELGLLSPGEVGGGNGGGQPSEPSDPSHGREPPPSDLSNPSDANNGTSPSVLANAMDRPDPGEVFAIPAEFDSQYLCEVQIGTPPQTLSMNLDTGSSDFWAFTTETPAHMINGQTVYDIGASTTAKIIPGHSWSITYGDGSFSRGTVYRDVVTIGDVTVQSQAINSAAEISQSFSDNTDQDGLVGLALSKLNTVQPVQQKTFFENAMENLAMPLFTANLKKAEPGSYTFGVIDDSEFEGDITFVDANTTLGFWAVKVDAMAFGNRAIIPTDDAIVDTGTTLLLVSPEIAVSYYNTMRTALYFSQVGGFGFACSESPPPLTVTIGDFDVEIPSELLNFAPLTTDGLLCFGGLQPRPRGIPFDILGDVFLKAVFTVFHGGDEQLGFATKPI